LHRLGVRAIGEDMSEPEVVVIGHSRNLARRTAEAENP
jgi:hypothetical protein